MVFGQTAVVHDFNAVNSPMLMSEAMNGEPHQEYCDDEYEDQLPQRDDNPHNVYFNELDHEKVTGDFD